MITPTQPLSLRAPGSTSNLGPGFDVLGLAVDRHLSASWEPGTTPLEVLATGTLAGLDPDRELVSRSLAEGMGVTPDEIGGRLVLTSTIPVARGLGSSAAARAVGQGLALVLRRLEQREHSGQGEQPEQAEQPEQGEQPEERERPEPGEYLEHADQREAGRSSGADTDADRASPILTDSERVRIARIVSIAEGHPDNAVPALMGGFVAASLDQGLLRWTPLPLSPHVGMAFAAPAREVRTDDARKALPATVPHAEAAANGARLATLLAGLARADGDRIAWGLADRLHMPYRMPLVPQGAEAIQAALEAGAWGVTLSGSGSGLIAFAPRTRVAEVVAAMESVFARVPGPGQRQAFAIRRELLGLTVCDAQGFPGR